MLPSSQYVHLILTATFIAVRCWNNFSFCFSTMLFLIYSCLCCPFSFFCSAVFLFSFRFMFWYSIVFGFVCYSWEWLLSKSTLFLGQIGLIRKSSVGWSLMTCSVCMIPNQFWVRHFVSLVWLCPRCARDSFLGWEIDSHIFIYLFTFLWNYVFFWC